MASASPSSVHPKSVDASLHTERGAAGPSSRTAWKIINGAEGFLELVAPFVLWQKISLDQGGGGEERERGGY